MVTTLQVAGPPAPETLRRDRADRRQRIVRTALRALVHGEYDQVKISEVARDSGVALGTVYRYFASKEHLFAAVYAEWQGTLKNKLERTAPEGDTEQDRLRDVFHRAIRAFQVQPQFFRLVMVLRTTEDTYATEIFGSLSSLYLEMLDPLFDVTDVSDRQAIVHTIDSVMANHLEAWVMNRLAIKDVYDAVDDSIRLIYEFPVPQDEVQSAAKRPRAAVGGPADGRRRAAP
jgi:AcrR family transcriptional regulator